MSPGNIASIYKQKAKKSYLIARQILNDDPNSAASRAYYSLYQAIVGELTEKGMKAFQVDFIAMKATIQKEREEWHHSAIKNEAGTAAGLNRREMYTVKSAYELRRKGDYELEQVNVLLLKNMLREIGEILKGLGVDPEK